MSCFGGGLSYVDEKVGVGISGVFGVGGGGKESSWCRGWFVG